MCWCLQPVGTMFGWLEAEGALHSFNVRSLQGCPCKGQQDSLQAFCRPSDSSVIAGTLAPPLWLIVCSSSRCPGISSRQSHCDHASGQLGSHLILFYTSVQASRVQLSLNVQRALSPVQNQPAGHHRPLPQCPPLLPPTQVAHLIAHQLPRGRRDPILRLDQLPCPQSQGVLDQPPLAHQGRLLAAVQVLAPFEGGSPQGETPLALLVGGWLC